MKTIFALLCIVLSTNCIAQTTPAIAGGEFLAAFKNFSNNGEYKVTYKPLDTITAYDASFNPITNQSYYQESGPAEYWRLNACWDNEDDHDCNGTFYYGMYEFSFWWYQQGYDRTLLGSTTIDFRDGDYYKNSPTYLDYDFFIYCENEVVYRYYAGSVQTDVGIWDMGNKV